MGSVGGKSELGNYGFYSKKLDAHTQKNKNAKNASATSTTFAVRISAPKTVILPTTKITAKANNAIPTRTSPSALIKSIIFYISPGGQAPLRRC